MRSFYLTAQKSLCKEPRRTQLMRINWIEVARRSQRRNASLSPLRDHATRSSVPRLVAEKLEDSHDQSHIAAVNQILIKRGIVLVDLKFPDTYSHYLNDLVLSLGKNHHHGPPIGHSATRGWFWDVRPTEKSVNRARSESSLDFPWHTDCSYESHPPQFFGLHVIHADQCGGGTFCALEADQILSRLKPSAYESLSRPNYRINVPAEFSKGIDSIVGSVISPAEDEGVARIRFRSDIFQPLSVDAEHALHELDELLSPGSKADIQDLRIDLSPKDLPDNTIVLMDNSYWLHSRTEIKDPNRHLRRLRWGRRDFGCEGTDSGAYHLSQQH